MMTVKARSLMAGIATLWLAAASGQTFITASSPVVGAGPDSVAVLDVNGNGKPDLIVASGTSKTLIILTNDGTGIFVSNTVYTTPVTPVFIVTADVNGDGKPDLIYSSSDNNTLIVLTNNGSGIFVSNAVYSLPGSPYDFVAADINSDGKVDLIVADYNGSAVTVLTNNGAGMFVSSGSFSCGSQYPRWIAVADYNGDGKLDLAVADYYSPHSLAIMLNNGNGTFSLSTSVVVGGYAFGVATMDVNGDGKPDLIGSAGTGGNVLSVCTNNGNGTFTSVVNYTVGPSPTCVAVATNVNGDDRENLICVNGDNTLTVLTNNGSGLFAQEQNTPVGTGANFIAVADVNGDGKPDLIVSNPGTNTLTVLTNASMPLITSLPLITGFTPTNGIAGTVVTVTGTNFIGATAVCFNGTNASFTANSNTQITAFVPTNTTTGLISIVTPNGTAFSSNNFTVVYPPFILSFSPTNGIPGTSVTITGSNFTGAEVITFNGTNASFNVNSDTQISAIVPINGTTGLIAVITPYGTAVSTNNFTVVYPPAIIDFSPTNGVVGTSVTISGANFTGATAVYFNGTNAGFTVNSNSQITATVPTNATTGLISVVTPKGTAFSSNNFTVDHLPAVLFTGYFALASTPVVGNAPYSVAVMTNFNGLGGMALISANYADKTLTLLTNNGTGVFVSNATYTTPVGPYCLAAADVNGDGKPDLIYSCPDNGTLTVLTNNGSGVLGSNAVYSVSGQPYDFVVADVNGDGKPDLISAGYNTGYVTVLTNNGNGIFTSSGNFTTSGNIFARWVVVADFNGDGRPDLAVAKYYDFPNVTILTNAGGAIFNYSSSVPVGGYGFGVAVADVNGDGKPDLISSGGAGGNVLTVSTNNGNGTFTNVVNYPVGSSPTCVTAADVTGDGKPDLICANSGTNTLTVLTNDGSGRFSIRLSPTVGNGPSFVVAADVNGDGMPDLICANSGTNTLTVLTNAGSISPPPLITGFSPASGAEGAMVTISGTNLSSTISVSFNGVPAGFSIVSDNQLTATVPSCAGTGPIAVIDPVGTATTISNFTFLKQPVTLTSPNEADLASALCNNSYVTLNFDGIVTNTSPDTISSDAVLDGTGHNVTISGDYSVGVFIVNPGVHLTLINLTIANGYAAGGGGINNNGGIVSLVNCTCTNNVATGAANGADGTGGAILNAGTLTLNNSTFVHNAVFGANGNNGTGQNGGNGMGGGIYNTSAGSVSTTNCTFYNNQAAGGNGGVGQPGQNGYTYSYVCGSYCCGGYGIFGCNGTCPSYCTGTVPGSPGGNGGNGGYGYGGDIYNSSGSVTVVNATFANGNVSGGSGGSPGFNGAYSSGSGNYGAGGYGYGGNIGLLAGGTMVLKNCIVANPNAGGNYFGNTNFTDAGNNLCSDASMGFPSPTSLNNVNPSLGSLTNNGGPTLTMALLPGSPAVRAGTTNGAPSTDQRGQPRKSLQIDMGAYETPVIGSVIPAYLAVPTGLANTNPFISGFFNVSFTNTPGTSFSLWSSTNLLLPINRWAFMGFPRETAPGQFEFNAAVSTNNPSDFYRVSSP
jgi:hypothetical protein